MSRGYITPVRMLVGLAKLFRFWMRLFRNEISDLLDIMVGGTEFRCHCSCEEMMTKYI